MVSTRPQERLPTHQGHVTAGITLPPSCWREHFLFSRLRAQEQKGPALAGQVRHARGERWSADMGGGADGAHAPQEYEKQERGAPLWIDQEGRMVRDAGRWMQTAKEAVCKFWKPRRRAWERVIL